MTCYCSLWFWYMYPDVVVKFKIEAGQAADCVKWQIELNHVKLEIRRVPAPRQARGDHGHEPGGRERPRRGGDLLRPRAGPIRGGLRWVTTQARRRRKEKKKLELELELKPANLGLEVFGEKT